MPRLQPEVLREDSMKRLNVLVVKSYTVSKKREHRHVCDPEFFAQQVVAAGQQRLEAVQRPA